MSWEDQPVWKGISAPGKDLIQKLLKKNHMYRYTAVEALKHPWMLGKRGAHDCDGLGPSVFEMLHNSSAKRHDMGLDRG